MSSCSSQMSPWSRFFVCFVSRDRIFTVVWEPVLELAIVDQAGLKLRDPSASASQVLGLKACATTAWWSQRFLKQGPVHEATGSWHEKQSVTLAFPLAAGPGLVASSSTYPGLQPVAELPLPWEMGYLWGSPYLPQAPSPGPASRRSWVLPQNP